VITISKHNSVLPSRINTLLVNIVRVLELYLEIRDACIVNNRHFISNIFCNHVL